jgi:hypothetical protein
VDQDWIGKWFADVRDDKWLIDGFWPYRQRADGNCKDTDRPARDILFVSWENTEVETAVWERDCRNATLTPVMVSANNPNPTRPTADARLNSAE